MEQDKNNKKIDLGNILKDSDKDIEIQKQKEQSTQTFFPNTPKIIRLTIKYSGGLMKDEKQANYFLIGFVILSIIASLILVFSNNEKQEIFAPEAEAPNEKVIPPAEF